VRFERAAERWSQRSRRLVRSSIIVRAVTGLRLTAQALLEDRSIPMDHNTTAQHSEITAARNRVANPPKGSLLSSNELASELSSRRTGMSFQRTRLSADRTLMSVIRTAISLITFGFTLSQTFIHLREAHVLTNAESPYRFGAALVLLGVVTLVIGIGYHLEFMHAMRVERARMKACGLVHAESPYPVSMVLIVAVLLLGIGILAFAGALLHNGPFG
jgi:putative membrane protein